MKKLIKKVIVPDSPISLPEKRVGDFYIMHKEVTCCDWVSSREGLLTSQPTIHLNFSEPRLIHELWEHKKGQIPSLWMSDLPVELRQMQESLEKMRPIQGDVLVGGLGLGVIAQWLDQEPGSGLITVIERSKEVIELCGTPNLQLINIDLYKYLNDLSEWNFSAAFFDTWQATNEDTWWDEVFPIHRMITNKFGKQNVQCWAEDIMLGQIITKITGVYTKPFDIKWHPHWHYKMNDYMSEDEAHYFTHNIGTTNWEFLYGEMYR